VERAHFPQQACKGRFAGCESKLSTIKEKNMSRTLQEYLAVSTQKAADDLMAALLRLPEDKRNWSPGGDARSALDMAAECAILNGNSSNVIKTRVFPADFDMAAFLRQKTELAQDLSAVQTLLQENTAKAIAIMRDCPDEDIETEIQMPWGPMTIRQIMGYPYWNMSYHEGQINYIASILGCLK
jgi:hypothetical protein